MAKTLFVFLFSNRTDPYINAMIYAFDELDVTSVTLVHVKGAMTGLSDTAAMSVANDIWRRLQDLAKVADVYKRMNEKVLDRNLVALTNADLGKKLNKLVKQAGGPAKCLFDLTGAAKGPSIDIFSVCLALGLRSVYAFELKQRFDPNDPEASLYHNLKDSDSPFEYTCLSDTEPVQASQSALLRKTPVLWLVAAGALIVLALSIILLATVGPNSLPLQVINIAAAVVGLAMPMLALFQERRTLG